MSFILVAVRRGGFSVALNWYRSVPSVQGKMAGVRRGGLGREEGGVRVQGEVVLV